MAKRHRGYVEVPVNDILEYVDDDDLLAECEDRGLDLAGDRSGDIREAYCALRNGRAAEALCILDRLVNPKWSSQQKCLEEFVKAQGKLV